MKYLNEAAEMSAQEENAAVSRDKTIIRTSIVVSVLICCWQDSKRSSA